MQEPPLTLNHEGKPRKVGFEIEYAGVDIPQTAELIAGCWGGTITPQHKNDLTIETETLGTFVVKLDMKLMRKLSRASRQNREHGVVDVEGWMETVSEPFITLYYPNEVVMPPLSIAQIDELEKLVTLLRENGAQGSCRSLTYAFGLHINPDVPSLKAKDLLAYIQAFVLLYDWLENEFQTDISREWRHYADDYSWDYAQYILRPEYHPKITQLIDDYLHYNPSRNYGLDMLPVFAFIDEKRVRDCIDNKRIKPRPTFHFRMPNSQVDDPSWNLEKEWNRWLVVERLACDDLLRAKMAAAYVAKGSHFLESFTHEWREHTGQYVEAMQ